jgi:hypothetical protein
VPQELLVSRMRRLDTQRRVLSPAPLPAAITGLAYVAIIGWTLVLCASVPLPRRGLHPW